VVRTFAGSDFTGRQIITAANPVSVYLCWPESALLAKAALMRLVWEGLIGEMLETYDSLQGQHCQRVLLLLDEAGAIHIPSLPQYVATVAGRGISVWAAYQDNAQLENLYGKYQADTIRNNMDSKVFYRQVSQQTAADIERSLGYRSGYAHSHTLRGGEEASSSLGETALPLLTARDINELELNEIIAFHSNYKPFRGKRMDWRAFPELVRRQALPPPPFAALPQVPEMLLPLRGRRQESWPRSAIDPDGLN
jgi:type IV secretory pathway TraG/TraD family ATPase VirD4